METIINTFNSYKKIKRINRGIKNKKLLIAYDYQNEGLYESIGKNSKMTCVTGSGKSIIIQGVSYKETELGIKSIICMPTKAIGNGFKRVKKVKFENDTFHFEITHDLCTENSSDEDSKSDGIVNFIKKTIIIPIKKDGGFIPPREDYIYLVTHKTLVNAFKKLQNTNELSYLRNIKLHIDEAHKIHYETNNEESEYINEMGKVIKHFIRYSKQKSLFINLVTATFYRNKFEDIVPSNFKWGYELKVNVLQYLKYCQYLKGFNYSLRIESEEYTESIKKIFEEDSTKPTIIFMPHSLSNQCLSYLDKFASVDEIKKAINNKNLSIVSLVEDGNERTNQLNYIEQNPDDVDVVINIKVAGEGFDWPNCTRIIICGYRTSTLEIPQNIGRVMRDHPNKAKNQPEVIQIISKIDTKNAEKVELKETFNNILKLVCGQLLLLSDLYSKEANKKLYKIGNKTALDYLNEITEDNRILLEEKIINDFIKLATSKEALNEEYTDDDLKEIIKKRSIEFGLEDNNTLVRYFLNQHKKRTLDTMHKEDLKEFLKKLKKTYPQLKGLNVDDIPIDLIENEIDSIGWIKNISSKLLNTRIFTELETVLNQFPRIKRIMELKEWVIKKKLYPNQKSKDRKEADLAQYLQMIRQTYKGNGTCIPLSKEEIALCESIPNWEWQIKENITRIQRIKILKQWIIENKRMPNYKKDKEIYKILKYFRLAKSRAKGKPLSKEEIALCETIPNWEWNYNYHEKRIKKIKEIKQWIIKNKRHPSKYKEEEKSLCAFKRTIRRIYKAMIESKKYQKYRDLSKEEIKLCESIPNWEW